MTTTTDPFIRLSPLEVAWGWVPGMADHAVTAGAAGHPRTVEATPPPRASLRRRARVPTPDGPTMRQDRATVRAALEDALLPALTRPPCLVAFSGGRDSSVILALALHLARREGLAEPVAVTKRHPAVAGADEDAWQELVVRHLGVEDWERLTFDELDLIGPRAQKSLTRHGLLWPPLVHTWDEILARARGGTLVSGEGGDEILGQHRSTPLAAWWALGRPNTPSARRSLALALGPAALRRWRRRRREQHTPRPWLAPEPHRELIEGLARDAAAAPLDFRRSVERVPRWRTAVTGLTNMATLAAEHHVNWAHPLLQPNVVGAVGEVGGYLGFAGRTAAMRTLFGDLLPDAVMGRVGKAQFTDVGFGEATRAFAGRWDGQGLNEALVHPAVLAAQWARDEGRRPQAGTAMLLQQAWLHHQATG